MDLLEQGLIGNSDIPSFLATLESPGAREKLGQLAKHQYDPLTLAPLPRTLSEALEELAGLRVGGGGSPPPGPRTSGGQRLKSRAERLSQQ